MKFNKYQIEAIDCEESATCIATAGSGKTTVLVEKVYKLSQSILPEDILCVAFNNEAVNNMKRRLLDRDSRLKDVRVSTIHSAALGCVRKAGYHYTTITERYDIVDYKTGAIKEYGSIDLMNHVLLNYMMEANSHKDDFAEAMLRYVGLKLSTMHEEIDGFDDYFNTEYLNHICNEYLKYMDSKHFLTYDMMVWKATNLLREDDDLREYVQSRYKYILVDECQDLSKDQYELIKIIAAKCKIFMVGDGLQNIYNFRGGDSQFLLKAHNDFEGMKVIHLPINYRCKESIVKTSNRIARITPEADDDNYMDAIAFRKGGEKPTVVMTKDVGNKISQILKENKGENWRDMAILGRTNVTLINLKSALYKNRIPCYLNDKFGLPKEIKLLCDYLRLLLDSSDDKSFLKVINTPMRYIGKATIAKIEAVSRKRKLSLFDGAMYAVYPSDRCYDRLVDFVCELEYVRDHKYLNAANALRGLIKKLDINKAIENQYKGNEDAYNDAMDNIEEIIKEASGYKTIQEFAREFLDIMYSNDEDGVSLSTVHKAKGLEWNTVVIAGFNDGMFPHRRSDNIEEEMHILYVALTRAKDKLVMVQDASERESPFLEALGKTVKIEKEVKRK